jgi:hypothetical protein
MMKMKLLTYDNVFDEIFFCTGHSIQTTSIQRKACFASCEIVALRENFVDRPESYDSFSAKSCVFLHTVWGIFLHPHTQTDPKQGIN